MTKIKDKDKIIEIMKRKRKEKHSIQIINSGFQHNKSSGRKILDKLFNALKQK